MSFVLQYKRLFSLVVIDESNDALLTEFSLIPAGRTQETLHRYQLVFRPRPAGGDVYYRLNPYAADPLLGRITSRQRFTFLLLIRGDSFSSRFLPDLNQDTGSQFYLDNLKGDGTIHDFARQGLSRTGQYVETLDAMRLVPPLFAATADMTGGSPPTEFIIRDKIFPAGNLVDVKIENPIGADQVTTTIDLSNLSPGPYTLETDAPGTKQKNIYMDPNLSRHNPVAVIDIHWETAQDSAPAGGQPYQIQLRQR